VPQQYKVIAPANNRDEQSHTYNLLTTIKEFNETAESVDRSPHALQQIETQSDQEEV
jgi:hypothetical protein